MIISEFENKYSDLRADTDLWSYFPQLRMQRFALRLLRRLSASFWNSLVMRSRMNTDDIVNCSQTRGTTRYQHKPRYAPEQTISR